MNFDGVFPDIWRQMGNQFDSLPDDENPLGDTTQLAMSGIMLGGKPLLILVRSRTFNNTSKTIVATGLAEINGSQGVIIEINGKFSIQSWREIWRYNREFKDKLLASVFDTVYKYPHAAGLAKYYLDHVEE